MSVSGKVAFITGASTGIGAQVARELVAQGARVALVARSKDKLDALVQELGEDKAIAFSADVCNDDGLPLAVSGTLAQWGQIDIVLANAGKGVMGAFDKLTLPDFQKQFHLNVDGVVRTFYATLDAVKKSKGTLAAVGSVAGYLPMPGGAAYSMSKAAVAILCGALKHEMSPYGVNVLHIAPGFIATDIRKRSNDGVLLEGAKDPVPDWLQMPIDKASRQIVRAIRKRKTELVVTGHGKIILFLKSYLPFFDAIMGSVLRRQMNPSST